MAEVPSRRRPTMGPFPLWCWRLGCGVAAAVVTGFAAPSAPGDLTTSITPTLQPPAPYVPPESPGDLLRVTPEMREFFRTKVDKHGAPSARLYDLVEAVVEARGLGFKYESEGTYDSVEAFRRRRGNCVAFSFLVVALCREYDLDASFQDVNTGPRWDRFGKLVASVRHSNVRVSCEDGDRIVDLRPYTVPASSWQTLYPVSDQHAFAQFYNNIGFFRLAHGDAAEALRYMELATRIDPQFAGAWANCAHIYARRGDLVTARRYFERALRADPGGLLTMDALVDVLKALGSPEDLKQAAKFERRAQWLRDRNPYFQQYVAVQAIQREDWVAADRFLSRAIALKSDEPEFYQQRVAVLQHLGRDKDAQSLALKLSKLERQLAQSMAQAP